MRHSTKLMPVLGAALLGCGIMTVGAAAFAPQTLAVAAETEIVEGSIQRVLPESNEFVLRVAEPESMQDDAKLLTIKVNEHTTYTLDGEESTMKEALVPGRHAIVTHEDKVAMSVAVLTEKRPS